MGQKQLAGDADFDQTVQQSAPDLPLSNLSKREQTIQEIITTEAAYAQDLLVVCEIYLPLAPLEQSDIFTIFVNIEAVFELATGFVHTLQKAAGPDQGRTGQDKLGSAFLNTMPQLQSTYQPYIFRHTEALARLEELGDQLSDYMQQAALLSQQLTNSWNLNALLIKPVQRFLKYPLLMEALLSETPTTHPDYENIVSAHSQLIQLAQSFNEATRSYELVSEALVKSRIKSPRPSLQQRKKSGGKNFGKSFGRTRQRLKTAVGLTAPPSPTSTDAQDMLDALTARLHSQHQHICQLQESFKAYVDRTGEHIAASQSLMAAWLETMDYIPGTSKGYQELETMIRYAELMHLIKNGPWKELHLHAHDSFHRISTKTLDAFRGPFVVVQKRKMKLLDAQRQSKDKRLSDTPNYTEEVTCLTRTLLSELPIFLHGTSKAIDLLVAEVARLQNLYSLRVLKLHEEFEQQYLEERNGNGTVSSAESATSSERQAPKIANVFWSKYRPPLDTLESFKITSKCSIDALMEEQRSLISQRFSSSLPKEKIHVTPPSSRRGQAVWEPKAKRLSNPRSPSLASSSSFSSSRADSATPVSPTVPTTPPVNHLGVMFNAIALTDTDPRNPRMLKVAVGEELAIVDDLDDLACYIARTNSGKEGFIKKADVVRFN